MRIFKIEEQITVKEETSTKENSLNDQLQRKAAILQKVKIFLNSHTE